MSRPSEHGLERPDVTGDHGAWAESEVREEVVEIALRAHARGFCRGRVATALDATRPELALIEQHIDAAYRRGAGIRGELVDELSPAPGTERSETRSYEKRSRDVR